jgi:AraC family transcriptional regulator of adaptative response / DNA-3-methyladenine glycosylase II
MRSHLRQDPTCHSLVVRLPFQEPFAADALLAFLAARGVPGVESVRGRTYSRTLRLPRGTGTARLTLPTVGEPGVVTAVLRLENAADLDVASQLCRRLLDLDADAVRADSVLAADPALTASVSATPGLRVPGAVDGPEILIRAMLGQQISVAAARTAAARLTIAADERLPAPDAELTHLFPSPQAISALGAAALGGPRRRAQALCETAAALAAGSLVVDASREAADLTTELVARPGIGPWTAGYVAMRVLGDGDVLLTGDLALRNGAAALGLPTEPAQLSRHAENWRPYRSYAGMHLWRAAPVKAGRS